MKIFCAIGIHSWSYSTLWCRTCHNCKRMQRRAGWNGGGIKGARQANGDSMLGMRVGWHFTMR